MKLTFVLRDKNNALKLSSKTIDGFMERIKKDTKDGAVARRRQELALAGDTESYDSFHPSHLIYPSAEFERDANDNLRMRRFNGVVALTIEGLETSAEINAIKQAAQILHYTLAAFVGATGKEVVILVKVAKADGGEVVDEEEADVICRLGHQLAATIYQGLLCRQIRQERYTVRSNFRMPLDTLPYYNPKAVALPVSDKPMAHQTKKEEVPLVEAPNSEAAIKVSEDTQRLIDFLNAHYTFRYNTIMGYTEYKDNSYQYVDWMPVDGRVMKGITMKVRLSGIDARDNDVRRYVQSDMIEVNPKVWTD